VELARALVARPQLLLLDESLAGVTLGEKQELAAHVRNARDVYGTTVVLIEHDIGVVIGSPFGSRFSTTAARSPTAHLARCGPTRS
jgi:ABC-type branched-subunit amino acid transport system ATPase component